MFPLRTLGPDYTKMIWMRPSKILLGLTAVASLAIVTSRLSGQSAASEGAVQSDLQAYMASRAAAYANLTSFSFAVYSDIHMTETSTAVLTRQTWQNLLTNWRDTGNTFGVIVGD